MFKSFNLKSFKFLNKSCQACISPVIAFHSWNMSWDLTVPSPKLSTSPRPTPPCGRLLRQHFVVVLTYAMARTTQKNLHCIYTDAKCKTSSNETALWGTGGEWDREGAVDRGWLPLLTWQFVICAGCCCDSLVFRISFSVPHRVAASCCIREGKCRQRSLAWRCFCGCSLLWRWLHLDYGII